MMKWIIVIIVIIVIMLCLLAGLGGERVGDPTRTRSPTVTPFPTVTPTVDISYITQVYAYGADIADSAVAAAKLADLVAMNHTTIDQQWAGDFTYNVLIVRQRCQLIMELKPPARHQVTHDNLVKRCHELSEVVTGQMNTTAGGIYAYSVEDLAMDEFLGLVNQVSEIILGVMEETGGGG